ncbi:MAG: outer membrane protein transport protein [Pseudomonadota bacterium]|nr:outer membrane protein transport protein [Pseudomonadota bacterium]
MKKILTLTALGTILLASAEAEAAGFLLREQSAAAMGNAFAGATAGAEDASYSFYNPAAIIRQPGTSASLNATAIVGNASGYDGIGPNGYNDSMAHIVDKKVLPSAYVSHAVNSRTSVGLSLSAPFGLITDYAPYWSGANHGTLSELTTYDLTAMVAYRATCDLTFGAGLVVQYVDATLKNGVAQGIAPLPVKISSKMSGDDTSAGFVLGALYEYTPHTRFGVGYRSEVHHKLNGKISFTQPVIAAAAMGLYRQDITAKLTTPAMLTFGVYHDIDDKWAVMAEAQKTYWSSFDNLTIKGQYRPMLSITDENWKDVWFYSVGTTYKYNDKLKLRLGLAYDNTPVNDFTRTPRIPDSDRIWYSAGAEYQVTDNLSLNAGYTYIRARKSKVALDGSNPNDATRGPVYASYKGNIHLFGLGLNYTF